MAQKPIRLPTVGQPCIPSVAFGGINGDRCALEGFRDALAGRGGADFDTGEKEFIAPVPTTRDDFLLMNADGFER